MSEEQKECVLKDRMRRSRPWHSPPHQELEGNRCYLITAACYEHAPIIGHSLERMSEGEADLLEVFHSAGADVYAWCVLPNHYHVLTRTERLKELLKLLGQFHGRSSFNWNGEENQGLTQINVPLGAKQIILSLNFPGEDKIDSYNAELYSSNGRRVWNNDKLTTQGQSISLTFNVTFFLSDDYEMRLRGRNSTSKNIPVSEYYFHISKK